MITPELAEKLRRVRGLVTGVVTHVEVANGRRTTSLTIAVGQATPLILIVRGGADYLLGKLVILRPAKHLLYAADSADTAFKVEAAPSIPHALISREFDLLKGGKSGLAVDSFDPAQFGNLPKVAIKALRKFHTHRLNCEWKIAELLHVIPHLSGREQDEVIHEAAVLVLHQTMKHGDFSGAEALSRIIIAPRRDRLVRWFRIYSSILIDLQRKTQKAQLVKNRDGSRPVIQIEAARANPFYR